MHSAFWFSVHRAGSARRGRAGPRHRIPHHERYAGRRVGGGKAAATGTNGQYEIAHETIVDHSNGQRGRNNGVNVMDSAQGFGVGVWGWRSVDTNTGWVSYGYPAGEAVLPINTVVIE